MRQLGTGLGVVVLTGILSLRAAAIGQGPQAPVFGSSTTVQTVQAYAFVPASSAEAYVSSSGGISCAGAPCTFFAPLSLPSGARVTAIQAEVCDLDAGEGILAVLFRVASPGGAIDVLASAQTAGAPGCVLVNGAPAAPETIDNVTYSYALQVNLGPSAATRLQSVRVFYALQVSLPPPVATFSDVPPGHPFYRFVEALVSSGITAGCGGGLYCVNNPITRGEMAVFLSVALGLHFAP